MNMLRRYASGGVYCLISRSREDVVSLLANSHAKLIDLAFADVAVRHGLQMIHRGKLRDFGYPVKWTYNLSNNELLEFRKN